MIKFLSYASNNISLIGIEIMSSHFLCFFYFYESKEALPVDFLLRTWFLQFFRLWVINKANSEQDLPDWSLFMVSKRISLYRDDNISKCVFFVFFQQQNLPPAHLFYRNGLWWKNNFSKINAQTIYSYNFQHIISNCQSN